MMSYFKKQLELLEYIKKPLSIESIDLLYRANNVRYENTLVYSDFTISLVTLVLTTYLGDEFTDKENQIKHFDWCWNKILTRFQKEQIDLKVTSEIKLYYYDFMKDAFYQNAEKEDSTKLGDSIIKYWKEIFTIQSVKTRAEVDVFLEIYNLFTSQIFNKK
jgi:hypothetical protein